MRKLSEYVLGRLIAGALVVAPIYLAVLLLLKGMKSLTGLLQPVAHLLPKWLPADEVHRCCWCWCSVFWREWRYAPGAGWEYGTESRDRSLSGCPDIR